LDEVVNKDVTDELEREKLILFSGIDLFSITVLFSGIE